MAITIISAAQQASLDRMDNNAALAASLSRGILNTPLAAIKTHLQKMQFNPNDIAAYKMSLAALVDLWRARFGDTWRDGAQPLTEGEENFWFYGTQRLHNSALLEKVEGWARLKESA